MKKMHVKNEAGLSFDVRAKRESHVPKFEYIGEIVSFLVSVERGIEKGVVCRCSQDESIPLTNTMAAGLSVVSITRI